MYDDVAYICILFKLIYMCVQANVATCVHVCSPVSTSVHQCPRMRVALNLLLTYTIAVAQRWSGCWQPSWRRPILTRLILTSRSCHV